jgi:pimeloyl-ACP methyl ester carboxylesterase
MRPKLVVIAILGLILPIALFFMKASSGGLNPEDTKSAAGVPDTAASSETAIDDFLKNQSEDHSMQWFYSDKQNELKGVALVIHGLNLRPDRMQPIISELTESGIDVLGLSLRGHGENFTHSKGVDEDQARLEAFKNVSYPVWMNEAYLAYLQLKARGVEKDVPIFLTAFSLGGLIGLELFASHADVQFDKLILFAPAIRLHAIVYLERVLSPFHRLVIPSLGPKSYLANTKGTPVAAYNALFEGLVHFEDRFNRKVNVPTLVFIDEEDELVSAQGLRTFVSEKKLDQWRFYRVQKGKSADRNTFYHHIIDVQSTGDSVWQDMMRAVANHLQGSTSQ